MHATGQNARFWIWWPPAEGFVKLTLKPGQAVAIRYGGRHEEGWSHHLETYYHNNEYGPDNLDGIVEHWVCDEGRDCDGYSSHEAEYTCRMGDLATNAHDDYPGILTPYWVRKDERCRDEFAEAAGY